jgi:hypothetical protein
MKKGNSPIKTWALRCVYLCLMLAGVAHGQMLTVSGSQLTDASGNPISNATISFAPVLTNGTPASFRKGTTGGQVVVTPVTAAVTSGAFSLQVADTSQTSPVNMCYAVTVTSNVTGASLLGGGYGCVQPASTGATWCSGTSCNFDAYPIDLQGQIQVQSGPTGPTGTAATISVGTTSTGAAGTNASVTNSGNSGAAVLNFTIPQGATGPQGAIGPQGLTGPQGPQGNQGLTGPSGSYGSAWGIVYAQAYTSLAAIEAACGSALCEVVVTSQQAFSIAANTTLPANIAIGFEESGIWTVSGTGTLTILGPVTGTIGTHFNGTTPIVFGTSQTLVPVEWLGAVGDWNGSTGTDNTAAIQACLNSLTLGQCSLASKQYKISGALTITKSGIGIVGTGTGIQNTNLYPNPSASVIITTSATADIIDAWGTSISANIYGNKFQNFTISRSVAPSGASVSGLSLMYSYAAVVDGVTSNDSSQDFAFYGVASQGIGYISNSVGTWGYNGVTETTGTYSAFALTSSNGVSNPSLRMDNDTALNDVGSGVTTYGLYDAGTGLNDLELRNFETANVSYGEYVSETGSSDSLDMHMWQTINDGCYISCMSFNGVSGPVEVTGGWNYKQPASATADINLSNSSNVNISNVQVYNPGTSPAVLITGGGGDSFENSNVAWAGGVSVEVSGSNLATITGNTLNGTTAAVPEVILITGTSLGDIVANNGMCLCSGGASASSAIYLDTSTSRTAGVAQNTVAGTFTTFVTDLGTANQSPTGTGHAVLATGPTLNLPKIGANGTAYQIRQWQRFTGSPLCTAAANGTCSYTITWTNAFPDANWGGQCTLESSSGVGIIWAVSSVGKTATTGVVYFHDFTGIPNSLSQMVCEGFE